jgi:hypothetical protein
MSESSGEVFDFGGAGEGGGKEGVIGGLEDVPRAVGRAVALYEEGRRV